MRRSVLVTLPLWAAACAADSAPKPDSGADVASPPCGDGTWGAITAPDDAIHVRADGDDAGDGTAEAPLATLAAALDLFRSTGRPLALGPGEYEAGLSLDHDRDDGFVLEGCGPGEVTLLPADPSSAVLQVTEATSIRLAGFSTSGGRRALFLWSGAEVELADVQVVDATRLGILIDGSDTIVAMSDVEVHDVVAEGDVGFGVQLTDGVLTMDGGGVWGATGAGVLVATGQITLTDVAVSDTLPLAGGTFGRGLQLQRQAWGAVSGGSFDGNADAGIFAADSYPVEIAATVVSSTAAGTVSSTGEATGDGIVVCQVEENLDPATVAVTISTTTVTGSARAGILLSAVSATLDGNTTAGNGLGDDDGSIFVQDDAVATGTDTVTELAAADALAVERAMVTPDDLAE